MYVEKRFQSIQRQIICLKKCKEIKLKFNWIIWVVLEENELKLNLVSDHNYLNLLTHVFRKWKNCCTLPLYLNWFQLSYNNSKQKYKIINNEKLKIYFFLIFVLVYSFCSDVNHTLFIIAFLYNLDTLEIFFSEVFFWNEETISNDSVE